MWNVKEVVPAEGEISVRKYNCTYYHSRLLGLEASGNLWVTSKRVIFHASGRSNTGQSIIQSEVPIEDVSGISSYKGTYFSLAHLLVAFFASLTAAVLAPAVLGLVLNVLGVGEAAIYVIVALVALGTSFVVSKVGIWRPILAAVSAAFFAAYGGASFISMFSFLGGGGLTFWPFLLSLLVAVYALVCILLYSRRPTFTLAINSRGGSSTPINISGGTGLGVAAGGAGRALNAEPAPESDAMLTELGAVVLDIQQLGELGITKWTTAS